MTLQGHEEEAQTIEQGTEAPLLMMGRQESVGVTALSRLAAVEEQEETAPACSLDYESPDSGMMLGSDEEWGT